MRPSPADAAAALREHGLSCWDPTRGDAGWARVLRLEDEIGLRSLPDIVIKLLAPPGCRLLVAARTGPVLGTAGEALVSLGYRDAVVLQGLEGSTDPSVVLHTRGLWIESSATYPLRVAPDDFGLACGSEPSGMHEDRLQAAIAVTYQALLGVPGPAASSSLLSAALLLRLAGQVRDLAAGVALAREALDSGTAQRRLEQLRAGR